MRSMSTPKEALSSMLTHVSAPSAPSAPSAHSTRGTPPRRCGTSFRLATVTWRQLWVFLAESERELGLDISEEAIAQLKAIQRIEDDEFAAAALERSVDATMSWLTLTLTVSLHRRRPVCPLKSSYTRHHHPVWRPHRLRAQRCCLRACAEATRCLQRAHRGK